jgi:hypothetical protein
MRRVAAVIVAAALLGGCGGGGDDEDAMIDWNLSASHTIEDVDWSKPDQTAVQIEQPGSVRIRFPGDKSFSGNGDIGAVGLERRGDQVTTVQVDSAPMTAEEAYEVALRWIRRWGLPKQPIEDWNERRQSGGDALTETAEAIPDPGTTVGPGGPEPSLKLLNSFNDDRPVIVSLRFFWS